MIDTTQTQLARLMADIDFVRAHWRDAEKCFAAIDRIGGVEQALEVIEQHEGKNTDD